jgi:8-oxo-dGTP diphosphatase
MKKFNIRVYGLLLNDKNEILVLDETRNDYSFTKFPGGGLEWGEGVTDCLTREFKEELAVDIQVGEMFYMTEHFVQSAFNDQDQLISIYYRVYTKDQIVQQHTTEVPRWVYIPTLDVETVTFPIDKLVVLKIKKEIN